MPGTSRQSMSSSKCGITWDSTGFSTEVMNLSSLSTTTQCLVKRNEEIHYISYMERPAATTWQLTCSEMGMGTWVGWGEGGTEEGRKWEILCNCSLFITEHYSQEYVEG